MNLFAGSVPQAPKRHKLEELLRQSWPELIAFNEQSQARVEASSQGDRRTTGREERKDTAAVARACKPAPLCKLPWATSCKRCIKWRNEGRISYLTSKCRYYRTTCGPCLNDVERTQVLHTQFSIQSFHPWSRVLHHVFFYFYVLPRFEHGVDDRIDRGRLVVVVRPPRTRRRQAYVSKQPTSPTNRDDRDEKNYYPSSSMSTRRRSLCARRRVRMALNVTMLAI